MKVYIIIQTEEYESGYIIHGVYVSKIIAIEKVESIIKKRKKKGCGEMRGGFLIRLIVVGKTRVEMG